MKVQNCIVNGIIKFNSVGVRLGRDGIILEVGTLILGHKIKGSTTSTVKYISQPKRAY